MGQKTGIQWTEWSHNPIRARLRDAAHAALTKGGYNSGVGHYCEKISPGCAFCYSGDTQPRFGLPNFPRARKLSPLPILNDHGAVSVSDKVEVWLDEAKLIEPLSWRKPRKVFLCDMTDLFGSWVPFDWIDRIFAVMALTPHITWQVLTKRPERMEEYLSGGNDRVEIEDSDGAGRIVRGTRTDDLSREVYRIACESVDSGCKPDADLAWQSTRERWENDSGNWPLPNVWLGASCERQQEADERLPHLLRCPAAVRFLSCEPLIGPIDLKLRSVLTGNRGGRGSINGETVEFPGIDWVIVGSESGPGRRAMQTQWARSIAEQCRNVGASFFMKQMEIDGRVTGEIEHFPAELKCRQFPTMKATVPQ